MNPETSDHRAFRHLPAAAAWEHIGSRAGFEVVFLHRRNGLEAEGSAVALDEGAAWAVHYSIALTVRWTTRTARISGLASAGRRDVELNADSAGRWRINSEPAPHLDGCVDVDLESSLLTNSFPVHRLGLRVGEAAEAPAAYVRALDLNVERLEQRYVRLKDIGGRQRYRYAAPTLDFECDLAYDEFGLLVDYPGLGRRFA
jgi:hypothetical protein